ncbi:MAG: hypothetical protein QM784_21110 [Polyangiaceae bacterium]
MSESPIDFSRLDPSRDLRRWESRIQFIADRAHERSLEPARQQLTVNELLIRWMRPMFAVAAVLALIGWLGLHLAPGRVAQSSTQNIDPAVAIATWAVNGEVPSTETVIMALGEKP